VLSLGPVSFAAPVALGGFVALAAIWWFLRLKPPAPVRQAFPAVRILASLHQSRESPVLTPLWLLILRLVLAALIILAASHPLWNADKPLRNKGPVYLIVDDDWAAAPHWQRRQKTMMAVIDQAERENRSMVFLSTAVNSIGAAGGPIQLISPAKARRRVDGLLPKPWPTNRTKAVKRLLAAKLVTEARPGDVFWVSNGLVMPDSNFAALTKDLRRIGALSVFLEQPEMLPLILRAPTYKNGQVELIVERMSAAGGRAISLRAISEDGKVLGRYSTLFKVGEKRAELAVKLPGEIFNRIARIEVDGASSVGGVVLVDERWRRRPVGLLKATAGESAQPLLSPTHYLERALEPFTEIRKGTISDLLQRPLAVLILTGPDEISGKEQNSISQWMKKGGVVLRFAGSEISRSTVDDDPLLPVKLRSGDRVIGGVMSWTKPANLADFSEASPFYGLPVTNEIEVRRQVLARPSPDLTAKTWARLNDGTPLITADRRGNGWLILVHTTASPAWSNLPISGLFVAMLRRIVDLSQGVSSAQASIPLAPIATLDAFARLDKPSGQAKSIRPEDFTKLVISSEHPPGFYGNNTSRQALNLSTRVKMPNAIGALADGVERRFYGDGQERDLRPWLMAAALVLFIIDTVISLTLRGLLRRNGGATAFAVLMLIVLCAEKGRADEAGFARDNSLETRLAYVLSGNERLDEISRLGLQGLTSILAQRTAAELGPPQGVDPGADDLSFFPLLYWPVPDNFVLSNDLSAEHLRAYMRNGGTILIDTRSQSDAGSGGLAALRRLAREMALPRLVPVTTGHVLARSFYLLKSFPGRWTGGALWIERAGERVNDGVSPIIVGSHDWAGAWAMDDGGRPLFPVVPGGERQRELAYRFGVNLVMYTLTGNYKADQVHLPAIIQRLGQ